MPEPLHFQHPAWLWLLLPLVLLLFWLWRQRARGNGWRALIDAPLQPLLLSGGEDNRGAGIYIALGLAWLLTVLALADPVWQRKPQPVFQTQAARVIVLDLSRSMNVTDIKPSRLARARFRVEDILASGDEGQTGLVVFAGDAFTVTPLTRDADTIRAMLPVLQPDMMPVQGSRADLGLKKAGELLHQAGIQHGQILLITDGVYGQRAQRVASQLRHQGHTVSVIGVGTTLGGPVPGLHDRQGKPVIAPLHPAELQAVAKAGGGRYLPIDSSDAALRELLESGASGTATATRQDAIRNQWQSNGPWLTLLLLPLAAFAFRRGWLLGLVLVVSSLSAPAPVMASPWDNLWLRRDQQATRALEQKQFPQAEQLASDPLRKGSAAYRAGHYEQAVHAFAQDQSADADYNRGNALARLGQLKQAIEAYDAALKKNPQLRDARINRQRVKKLLEQRQKRKNPPQSQHQKSQNRKQSQEKKQAQNSHGSSGQQSQPSPDQGKKSATEQSSGQQSSGQAQRQQSQKQKSGQQGQHGNQKTTSRQQDQAGNQATAQSGQQQHGENKKQQKNAFAKAAEALKKQQQQKKADSTQDESATPAAKQQEQASHSPAGQRQAPRNPKQGSRQKPNNAAATQADELSREERMAAEQWLRRIPDDPAGLLRRKFQYQYRQRPAAADDDTGPPW